MDDAWADEAPAERAVVDRVVDGYVVVLVGDDEEEHHLAADRLPAGTGEGTQLWVRDSGEQLAILDVDVEGEEAARADARKRLRRLRRQRRGGRFDRDEA